MKRVVLDTNVYIDWINRGLHADLMVGPGLLRYMSAIVALELRAGARTRHAVRAVDRLSRAYTAALRWLLPTPAVYEDAGRALQRLRRAGREVRSASLVNDVLIAVSARSIGATVLTADASDFEAIRAIHPFSLEVV